MGEFNITYVDNCLSREEAVLGAAIAAVEKVRISKIGDGIYTTESEYIMHDKIVLSGA